MNRDEWEERMYEQDYRLLIKNRLPDHDELLSTLRALIPTTGNLDELFCNAFLCESVELLKHAFFLYEDGYFDCAFYSLRQSIENMNNMLLSAVDANKFEIWKEKGRFPSDKTVKDLLCRQNDAYNEFKAVIPEFFEQYDELLKKANKYIHKQGFDTFYIYSNLSKASDKEERTNLFLSFLKYAIGMMLIVNIALDPLSLALSDFEVDSHIPFEPMTQPIPIGIFEKYLSLDIIDKIKTTNHYSDIKNHFLAMEELNEATYAVLRFNHFNVEQLNEIEKQLNKLDLSRGIMFCILKSGIKATHFYWDYDILGYSTTYQPKVHSSRYSLDQFDDYLNGEGECNCPWQDMYISIFKTIGSYLIIQHDEPLTQKEVFTIRHIVANANQRYQSEIGAF